MVYYSIKESAELTGVSLSTVKRKLTKFKNEHPKKYKDKGNVKFEKSKAGNAKTLISESWLREYFDIGQSGSSEPLTLRVEGGANQEFIDHLKKELDLKNQQLSEKDKQIETLLERNKETNLLFAQAQQKQVVQLEENTKKKRWWQR
jgi:hypothetical protein